MGHTDLSQYIVGLISGSDGIHSIYCGVKHLGLANTKQESVHYGAGYLGHIDLSQYIVGLNIWGTQT